MSDIDITDPRKAVFDAIRAVKGRVLAADVPVIDEALDRIGFPRAGAAIAPGPAPVVPLAWGARVSPEFRAKARAIAGRLRCDPSHLMACMAFETGRSFSPAEKNRAGSGATGLIQFMPSTALGLFFSPAQIRAMTEVEKKANGLAATSKLAAMSAIAQLDWVEAYFRPYAGKLGTLSDLYMAVLWPAAIGKPEHHVLWDKASRPTTYRQNAGLDANRDGRITKAECSAKLHALLTEGQRPENVA